jgi:arginyl-tRNA synthetase
MFRSAASSGRIIPHLKAHLAVAVAKATGLEEEPSVIEATDPRFGDYQTNVALYLAPRLKERPRQLAERIASVLSTEGMCDAPEVAGQGFINLRLNRAWLSREICRAAGDPRLDIAPVAQPETIVVDFSSPNVAKRMHVGHLRSTIIGDAIIRILRFLGHQVIGDNHVGDWGTQFGVLIWAWRNHRDETKLQRDPIAELERLYRVGYEAATERPGVAAACRAELARLQAGEKESLTLWSSFVRVSRTEAERLYAKLGVTFDLWMGESAFSAELPALVAELKDRGLARESDGATAIFFPAGSELADQPFLVQKSDAAFLYSTTDIAALRYRLDVLHASWVIYVVDSRQALHFKQLFTTARMMGYESKLEHVGFGMMLGEDGRPFKTREGGTVSLEALLDDATERILPIVRAKWPELEEEKCRDLAARVGVGAVKYADLSQNLASDYRFDWDRMLAAEGNTGPYLQYTLVRIRSVLRVYATQEGAEFVPGQEIELDSTEALNLGRQLLRFGDTLDRAAGALRPHLLCEFLYGIARIFNTFYSSHSILGDEDRARRLSRVMLCYLAGKTIDAGLSCLNIPRVSQM